MNKEIRKGFSHQHTFSATLEPAFLPIFCAILVFIISNSLILFMFSVLVVLLIRCKANVVLYLKNKIGQQVVEFVNVLVSCLAPPVVKILATPLSLHNIATVTIFSAVFCKGLTYLSFLPFFVKKWQFGVLDGISDLIRR